MVGIRFFSRFCQFDCPQLWSRPSPTAYRIVSQQALRRNVTKIDFIQQK
ncbi:putative DNA binding / transcription factor [Escherichia coli 5-366-08_S1_C1]|nr:putative DNA binding / transcription factor [Escherichia coli 5-366-08_S1_C3]KEL68340.1 putative DNA binding / transcription factor [Escherichia coli 5-366-08_S1_C1]